MLDEIAAQITPASEQAGALVRAMIETHLSACAPDSLTRVAMMVAEAQHSSHPRVTKPTAVVCAADHGVSGVKAPSLTLEIMRALGESSSALQTAARAANATVLIADCGAVGGEPNTGGPGSLSFRIGNGTNDFRAEAAMTPVCAVHAVQAGIALGLSLGEGNTDLIALGGVGAGSATSAATVIAALCGIPASEFESDDAAIVAEALALHRPNSNTPLEVLATVGGFEIGVLTGVILAASSIRIPIVLDDSVTVAAALLAATIQPNVARYLIASHAVPRGYRAALDKLGLEPLFGVRISHGEGTGALLALPMIVAATGVVAELG